jgi:metal-responsive CopG/Arc/MetJ family transcriptional regulator
MGRKKLGRDRVNITLPKGMSDELAAAAKEKGWDRSRLIEELCAGFLKRREKERAKGPAQEEQEEIE